MAYFVLLERRASPFAPLRALAAPRGSAAAPFASLKDSAGAAFPLAFFPEEDLAFLWVGAATSSASSSDPAGATFLLAFLELVVGFL